MTGKHYRNFFSKWFYIDKIIYAYIFKYDLQIIVFIILSLLELSAILYPLIKKD